MSRSVAHALLFATGMRVLACLVVLSACTTDLGTQPAPQGSSIDDYIESLPYLPVDPPQVVQGPASAAQRDGDYQCSTTNLKETRNYDEIVAYAANSDSLWPGAIVSADSVVTGLFTQIVLPRAPATISVSLENLDGKKTATIADPSLSTYRDALSGILDSTITGSTAANLSSEIEEVHSQEQLNMALGVQASWGLGVASLKSSFDFSNQQIRSRYVVKFTQNYYTVDLDAPSSPSSMFDPATTLEMVKDRMDDTRPPAYVSSVTYGRMVLFTFESQYSAQEMGAALEFAYSGGADVSGQVSVTYKDILSSSKITAYILGGDAGSAVMTIDSYDALIAFIKAGGNYSKDSPGAPIAYKLRYLKDNSPARMSMTDDYDVKECTRVSQKLLVTLQSIAVDSGGDRSLYGDIWATGDDTQNLMHKDSGSRIDINQGAQFGQPMISQAIVAVTPQPGHSIALHAHLWDHDTIFADDDLGNETSDSPFETGWRKDVTVNLTGDSGVIRVVFSITPI